MRVLITGGAGFIGSHLAEACLKRGDEVYIIDDLSTGSLNNLKPLQDHEGYKHHLYVTVDSVLNREQMMELVGTCDLVYHLAAAVGVQYILDHPLSSLITNVQGTEVVLELCSKFKKQVLIASTSEVYGKRSHAPLFETDDSCYGPSHKSRWSYAASKLMDEFLALGYWRAKRLPVVIVRLFNTVGPRQTGRYGMVIPRFVKQALAKEPLTVYGDGTQTRTFTHVKDVVDAMQQLMATPRAMGEVVNIGGTQEISIRALAQAVIQKTASSSVVTLIPYEQVFPRDFEDMMRRVPSIEKLKTITGFEPSRNLGEILDDVIAAFEQDHVYGSVPS